MRAEYLLVLAVCLVVTAPLEIVLHARVYRRPARLAWAVLPVVIIFTGWDLLGIHRGHWSYSPTQTTGWLLPGRIPIEEVAFFVVIPICALLTYEAVGILLDRLRPPSRGRAGTTPERTHTERTHTERTHTERTNRRRAKGDA